MVVELPSRATDAVEVDDDIAFRRMISTCNHNGDDGIVTGTDELNILESDSRW